MESGREDLNMCSDDQDILYSKSGTGLSENDNTLLFLVPCSFFIEFQVLFSKINMPSNSHSLD